MKNFAILLLVSVSFLLTGLNGALADESTESAVKVYESIQTDENPQTVEVKKEKEEDEGHSFLVGALLYIPNRVLDLFDIFRFRVRVGPGIAAGARVTEVVSLYAGTYATLYAGLPGPRMRQTPKLPIGFESLNGVSASVLDATVDGGIGPDYSPTEVGAGVQLAILGFDIGIDPVEIADFATGILTIDLRDDDL